MLAFMLRDDDDSGDDGDCDDDATDQFRNGGVSSVVPWEYICPLKYICTNKRCIFSSSEIYLMMMQQINTVMEVSAQLYPGNRDQVGRATFPKQG